MGKVDEFLSGVKIIEEVNSPINGNIRVVKSLGLGTYIQVEGLTQSGGVMYGVWRTVLKKVKSLSEPEALKSRGQKLKVRTCLILGLGGGDAARLIKKYWPEAVITGVEIDPIMVDLGRKYLGLDKIEIETEIEDAYKYVSQKLKVKGQKFDLILVDLYVGYDIPDKFTKEKFLKLILKLLSPRGIAVFNRFYHADKKKEAEKLEEKLEKIFSKVTRVYPKVNVMFVCQ